MQRIIQFFSQRATTLFFPMALILYDFAAYLTTDLIQLASLTSCAILMLMSVLRRPRSVSIWREEWRCNGFWGRYPTGLAAGQC